MANPTVQEIVAEALEEIRARGLGDDPSPEEAERGLRRLQAMFNSAVEQGVFGRVEEYYATGDHEAEEGQRVFANGHTITLPTAIEDLDSDTNYRRPRDFAMIQVVDDGADPEISVYDAHEAAWTRLDSLTLAGECPFGRRYRHGLVAALGQAMGPVFGKGMTDITSAYAAAMRSALALRQSAPRSSADMEFM